MRQLGEYEWNRIQWLLWQLWEPRFRNGGPSSWDETDRIGHCYDIARAKHNEFLLQR